VSQVNPETVVFVTFDTDTNSTAASLAEYADENAFPWVFAVMTPELSQALAAQFGSTVLIPPFEPQWLIRPDGSVEGLIADTSSTNLVSLINSASS
jgi:hypothetical protein